MKKTLLTLLALSLSLNACAADPFTIDPAKAGIKEPAEGSDAFFTAEAERQRLRSNVRAAKLGDDMFVITLKNVPQHNELLDEFVMDSELAPITNYTALNQWLSNTIGIAKSPADLKSIKPYLKRVIKEQPNLKIYATQLLNGPYAQSEEDIFSKTATQRAEFLKMFQ